MIRSMRTLRVLSFAAAALLALFASGTPAGAQDAGLDQGWKHAIQYPCVRWNGNAEYHCRSDDRFGDNQTQSVKITNHTDKTVTVKWSEHHTKFCKVFGGRIEDHQFTIAPNQEISPFLLAPGNGIACRDVFLHGCTEGGQSKNCPDVITAVLRSWKGSDQ